MNNGQNRMLDELTKMAVDFAGSACGVQSEIKTFLLLQVERILNKLDLVKREEFEALKELLLKVQEENIAISEKIALFEKQIKSAKEEK